MPYPYYNTQYPIYQQPQYQTYQPQIVQPVMQQSQPQSVPQQTTTPPTSIMWVNNEREAAMYPILPNTAVALWDESSPVVYLKQADASGKPTMKTFDLVERTERISESVSAPEVKLPDYATKDEIQTLASVIDSMHGSLDTIRSEMETMKGDLYGIAGKKKPTKKVDIEDE